MAGFLKTAFMEPRKKRRKKGNFLEKGFCCDALLEEQ